jgi:amino-acid N-acetyltransferase
VHPDYRKQGRGDRLISRLESLAKERGLERLFVLTTQTSHWFRELGYEPAEVDDLPAARRADYNRRRGSQIYLKRLLDPS